MLENRPNGKATVLILEARDQKDEQLLSEN